VPGVTFFWIGEPVPRAPLLYDAGIVIIGQGHKVGFLGDRRFRYDAESCLVLGVPVPFECETYGTPDEPLLGIRIDIDLTRLHGLVARFGGRLLKAKGLLVFEPKQVSEAAYEVGYASPSQFSRELKRYFHVPPSEAATLPYNDAA